LGLTEENQKKPHLVVAALKELYGASIGVSGERPKFLGLIQDESESITSWETRVRNPGAQCEYENFADELMKDQSIAGLASETLCIKLIGKGQGHQDVSQTKVTLKEVVETAKCFEASTYANQLMKTARGNQEQVNFTSKPKTGKEVVHWQLTPCYWCNGSHQQPCQQHCPAYGKRGNKCGIIGHFSCACKSRPSHQKPHQQLNFVKSEPSEEAFVIDGEKTAWSDKRPGRKFFAHLHLIHGGKTKVVQAQIDTASTCNTMPESLLRKLFSSAKISKTKTTISTYGDQTLRPKGQVTLCCERKGKLPLRVPSSRHSTRKTTTSQWSRCTGSALFNDLCRRNSCS